MPPLAHAPPHPPKAPTNLSRSSLPGRLRAFELTVMTLKISDVNYELNILNGTALAHVFMKPLHLYHDEVAVVRFSSNSTAMHLIGGRRHACCVANRQVPEFEFLANNVVCCPSWLPVEMGVSYCRCADVDVWSSGGALQVCRRRGMELGSSAGVPYSCRRRGIEVWSSGARGRAAGV